MWWSIKLRGAFAVSSTFASLSLEFYSFFPFLLPFCFLFARFRIRLTFLRRIRECFCLTFIEHRRTWTCVVGFRTMRVHTYHTHAVQRNSPLLHALISLHVIFSICYSAPILFTYLGLRWQWQSTTSAQKTWMVCVLIIWFCAEVGRLYLGRLANRQTLFGELIGFLTMTIVPQVVLIAILFGLLPQRNDLEYGVCVTQFILLGSECLAAIDLLIRITRNNVIDFYVALGSPYAQ